MKQKPIHASMQTFLDGEVVLIDKPLRWTSFDAVKKVRILTRVSKVGHAGTLDPLASGLLIICTGKFTKKINEYMGMEKEYTGQIMQVPPIHSAIKKEGKRVYELARKGHEVVLDARPVTISSFEITNIDLPIVAFKVVC